MRIKVGDGTSTFFTRKSYKIHFDRGWKKGELRNMCLNY